MSNYGEGEQMNPESSQKKAPGMWAMLWPKIKPYRWLVLIAIIFNAAHGIAISYQTLMTKYLIDDVVLKQGIAMSQRIRSLTLLMTAYLLISLIGRMAVWHIGFRFFTYVRERVLMAMRLNFFSHVNHLCLRFHRSHKSGELFNYLFGSTLGQIQNYFQQFTLQVPGAIFTLIWTIVWVARWDWIMTGVLCISVLTTVIVLRSSRRIMHKITKEFQQTETAVSGYVADLLRGTRDVKLFAIEEQIQEEFAEQVDMIRIKSYEREVKTHLQWMKQESVGYFCFALLCIMGTFRYLHHQITIGEFQAYLASFMTLQWPLQTLFNVGTQKGGAQASFERLEKVMQTASSTPDPVKPMQPVPASASIAFKKVSFKYEDALVLKDLDIMIPYGQHVALVGPSGAGKTTLVQLILRLYDAVDGSLLMGDLDIKQFKGSDLRRRFGVVPQDPFIFSTTIRENLQIVSPEAKEQAIVDACRHANAWEFIDPLPRKLDTSVAEGGATLSGGQRQRLAIARALLANPSYFIFDEATSALDTLSERLIQNSIETAMRGRTALIIAHRLATVKNCDRILVMENGAIAQDGTYAELTQKPGLFADLVAGQQLRA
jgi:ABC-type multidrug transport system fused ATPase/permease subunit